MAYIPFPINKSKPVSRFDLPVEKNYSVPVGETLRNAYKAAALPTAATSGSQLQPQTQLQSPNIDEALKQKYIASLISPIPPPTPAGAGAIPELIKEGYGGEKKDVLGAILGGATGVLKTLGSSSGMKILSGLTKDPYKAAGYLGEAERLQQQEAAEQQAYKDALAREETDIGGYLQAAGKLKSDKDENKKEFTGEVPEGYRMAYDKYGTPIVEKIPLGAIEEESFTREKNIRNEYTNAIGDYPKIRDAYVRILGSAIEPDAQGDMAMVFNFMKILDPGSTVREGEFATAKNAAGIPARIRAAYNNAQRGELLTPETRQGFVDRSKKLFTGQLEVAKSTRENYKNLAKQYKLDPDRIAIDLGFDMAYIKESARKLAEDRVKKRKGKSILELPPPNNLGLGL